MRISFTIAAIFTLPILGPLEAAEVPVARQPITVDGDLREWGPAAWIPIAPAGDGVGLRGVFQGAEDHDADVLVQWDAQFLYLAAVVTDDTLDAGRVAPDAREWQGSGGQRKDRMFYFDHMKVFVREPGANAGYNLWVAPPGQSSAEPYWWGGRQRQVEQVHPAIRLASLVRDNTRTFEMAIPWSWMEAFPQTGDVFDAMFLFTDSDMPDLDVAVKIARQQDRWIWWQGKLELTGQPQGLRPRPPAEPPKRDRPIVEAARPLDSRVTDAIARSRQKALAAARADSMAASQAAARTNQQAGHSADSSAEPTHEVGQVVATGTAGVSTSSASESASGDSEVGVRESQSSTGSLRARLNRRLLARRNGAQAPDYLRSLERDPELTSAQVDTFYVVLRRQFSRIVRERITSRVDFFVVDMATAASCRRDQSRKYLVDLLRTIAAGEVTGWVADAAAEVGIEQAPASAFITDIAQRAAEIFAERGVTTSAELIKRGRKKSRLDEDQAYALIGALLGPDLVP
jgi:hypothetical protein